MLVHIKIKDLAIIDKTEISVPQGFTVITGETGAGKSILVDALVVALGGRAAQDLIRTGAESAEVEALFDISGHPVVRARLEQRDLVGDEPDVLLVRRVIGAKGKAKVLINGHLSTVATLAEIVRGLVDISGQHEQLSLLQDGSHVDVLDAFGELEPLREQLRTAYEGYVAVVREREALEKHAHDNAKHADFLRFQLDEIERAGLTAGEDQELAAEQRRLAHAEKLKGGAELAEGLLYGEDGSAFDKLGKAAAEIEQLSRIDAELAPVNETLASARRDIEEAARALSRYASRIEADPERLAFVDERLSTILRLCRKHGGDLTAVLQHQDAVAKELDTLVNSDARLAELAQKAQERGREVLKVGKELSKARQKAAKRLDKAILAEVAEMELAEAVFLTSLTPRPAAGDNRVIDGVAVGPTGLDEVEFLWSANRGEEPRPLARIASGGELSRLMLAVKTVLSSRDLVSLYVFDEVDTGLGGKAADSIGRKIQRVARGHQALTITHLASIAARADHHLRVDKEVRGERTVSRLRLVEGKERDQEIARMIDGAKITATTLEAAKAMLARAQREAGA